MSQPLFRREVLEAKRGSWLGSISLAQPLPLWGLTGFAALAAVSTGALAKDEEPVLALSKCETNHGTIAVVDGAKVEGIIIQLLADVGDAPVTQGD